MGFKTSKKGGYVKFKAYMVEKGITLDELSALLGKSKKALQRNLDGVSGDLGLHDAVTICRTYGITAEEYLCDNRQGGLS